MASPTAGRRDYIAAMESRPQSPTDTSRRAMITVHHLNNSRSQRVLWLLEELGVPYEIRKYQRDAKTMLAPPELTKVHPLGKSPVITEGDVTVAETGAIVEYVLEQYGGGRLEPAAGTPERRRMRYWLHFAEGSAMPPLLLKLIFDRMLQRIERGDLGPGSEALASMKVTQQSDAIRALGTSPIKKIVIPRLLASLIALPILTLFADFIGLFGAMLVSLRELSIGTLTLYTFSMENWQRPEAEIAVHHLHGERTVGEEAALPGPGR